MNNYQKFFVSFVLALALHLTILALFGLSFSDESQLVKQQVLPEIIQASMLDDDKIQEEAKRLKVNEKNKQLKRINRQNKEQQLFEEAKNKRKQEENKAKVLEQKRLENEIKQKQKLAEIDKLKNEEVSRQKKVESLKVEAAARQAKIKQQLAAEKKRTEDLHQEKERKKELARIARKKKLAAEKLAAEKTQRELKARQEQEAIQKADLLKKQIEVANAKILQDKQAVISATAAIQRKVNNRWIKPQTAIKGLSSTVRVKLLPSGDVMDAKVIRSSGDSVFDRSAENAVRKASPFPVPSDRALFTKQFRSFTFEFKPE